MAELTCGIHALDSVLHDECVRCLGIRLAARDAKIERNQMMNDNWRDAIDRIRTPGGICNVIRRGVKELDVKIDRLRKERDEFKSEIKRLNGKIVELETAPSSVCGSRTNS